MTQHLREMSLRSRNALPRNRFELAAWLIRQGGLGMIFLVLLSVVWYNGERRNDELRDIVRANVQAFQQVSADLQAQRQLSAESQLRMRESVQTIMDELREIRRRDPATTHTTTTIQ